MAIVGGSERREVDGSTDEFGWFAAEEIDGLSIGDLVERVIASD
jgi:hypothetical protein